MRSLLAALFLLLAADRALAGDGPAVKAGDTYQSVIDAKGKPLGEIDAGISQILKYPDAIIKLRDGVVVNVTVVAAKAAPAAAADAGPTKGPDGLTQMVFRKDAIEEAREAFADDVRSKFKAERFPELDALAAGLIAQKALFGDGSWKIVQFHDSLDLKTEAPEESWNAREALIEKWEAQNPASITARIEHIRFLTDYAWHARGNGWANKVDPKAWPVFENRLAQAYILYQSATKFSQHSPMLAISGERIALGQGWALEETTGVFEAARQAEPTFWGYDVGMAIFLLPRWYGKEGDWEAFADNVAHRGDGLGPEEYARVAFAMERYCRINIFKEAKADWPTVREGYKMLIKRYPDALSLVNQYALLAELAEDRAETRAAFDRMNGRADPQVWRSLNQVAKFEKWAYWSP